jgi:hypothetical protein
VDELAAKIRPAIAETGIEAGQRHDINIDRLKARISDRAENVRRQLDGVVNVPRMEAGKAVRLTGWQPRQTPGGVVLRLENSQDGSLLLNISASNMNSSGSWRTRKLLEQGRYQFRGRIRTKDLRPIPGEAGTGAELRILQGAQPPGLTGTGDWREFVYQFSVWEPAKDVEFLCELKSSAGEAWFEAGSLRIVRLP